MLVYEIGETRFSVLVVTITNITSRDNLLFVVYANCRLSFQNATCQRY